MVAPLVASVTPVLIVTRVAMGLGEGVAFPALVHLIGQYIPPHQRTRAIAIILSGSKQPLYFLSPSSLSSL